LEHVKRRVGFFIDRWGNSPAIFGYDLFNEIHPHWGGDAEEQYCWLGELARFVKERELARWGKRHLLTVSVFGSRPENGYAELVLDHPELDFATTHVYEFGVVDNPDNTVDGALVMRDAVRYAYNNMNDVRPYTDTESGPIHAFMDLGRQLPEEFDDEYHHNMCWAHLASGGAGSGMRWPFRSPHTVTDGMRANLRAISRFSGSLDWVQFSPRPVDDRLRVAYRGTGGEVPPPLLPFGCTDGRQTLVWLLRDLRSGDAATPLPPTELYVPGILQGDYVAEFWNTYKGTLLASRTFQVGGEQGSRPKHDAPSSYTRLPLPAIALDLAIVIKPRRE
jgi:mannan endo-1,4-beta-mannosidase